MKTSAKVSPGVAALRVTVFGDGRAIHGIVTREMLEHLYGDIEDGQDGLLGTFEEHAADLEARILGKYHDSLKDPVVLHFKESPSRAPT